MKERPILFSGAMVRAILAGTKTQTRRVVKPQPTHFNPVGVPRLAKPEGPNAIITCPYGLPGDLLIVRETWQYANWTEDGYPFICYQANGAMRLCDRIPTEEWSSKLMDIWAGLSEEKNFAIDSRAADRRWRPSIHMPRWASRITLEITGVRVELLQDLSDADAIAEGIERGKDFPGWYRGHLAGDSHGLEQSGRAFKTPTAFPKLAFRSLWESINGAESWAANPWVWVVEFKRLEV